MDTTLLLVAVLGIVVAVIAFLKLRGGKSKQGKVTALYIYPIKSTFGLQVTSAEIGTYGFKYDREWMLIDGNNNFISQRVQPRMALIKTALHLDQGILEVNAPGMPSLKLPLAHIQGPELDVTVWGTDMGAVYQGDANSKWFSDFLGAEVRLVRIPADHDRVVDQRWTSPKGDQLTSYADGFPYLVASESSLEVARDKTLEGCGENPITIRNFRPNIVLSGFDAWEELLFERAKVGGATLYLTKPCTRCKLTTVVPDKGFFGGDQPLKYIRDERKSIFGMNAIHSPQSKGKMVKVNDTFSVDCFRETEIVMK